jgi:hypothetical protein
MRGERHCQYCFGTGQQVMSCKYCHGLGLSFKFCEFCKRTGIQLIGDNNVPALCQKCTGFGKIAPEVCMKCYGKGWLAGQYSCKNHAANIKKVKNRGKFKDEKEDEDDDFGFGKMRYNFDKKLREFGVRSRFSSAEQSQADDEVNITPDDESNKASMNETNVSWTENQNGDQSSGDHDQTNQQWSSLGKCGLSQRRDHPRYRTTNTYELLQTDPDGSTSHDANQSPEISPKSQGSYRRSRDHASDNLSTSSSFRAAQIKDQQGTVVAMQKGFVLDVQISPVPDDAR